MKGSYVYEVSGEEAIRIMRQPAVSKDFLEDCKKVADKYRKNNAGYVGKEPH